MNKMKMNIVSAVQSCKGLGDIYHGSNNSLSLSVTVADVRSNASSTTTPPFSIEVDKNPFFH